MKIKLHIFESENKPVSISFDSDVCPNPGEAFSYEDKYSCYEYLHVFNRSYVLGDDLNYIKLMAYSERC